MKTLGVETDRTLDIARDPALIVGYLEAHIEQGPVLEANNRPVAAVSAICGISRFEVTVSRATGHVGTMPMAGRQDALVTASRVIVRVSELASAANVRATVGTISVGPWAVNAIPADVRFKLEFRAARDEVRKDFEVRIQKHMRDSVEANGCKVCATRTHDQRATVCDPMLTGALEEAIRDCGIELKTISSAATHDASAMSDLCPVSMLFVRCRGGISHRLDEFAKAEDMEVAVRVLERAITLLATEV